ncbi:MAG TPA: replication-relaxation family protein [Candidatus Saccharimonadales bacterium]
MNKTTLKTTNQQTSSSLIPRSTVITKQQIKILIRIYDYRFVTTSQLQQVLAKKQIQQVQQRLNLLLERGYIGRNFSSQDRLTGRYASYYLLPKGMKVLKRAKDYTFNPKVFHNIYKDKTASTRFINHCIGLGDINCYLERLHGDALEYFTKTDLIDDDYFPNPRPDAFLKIHSTNKTTKTYSEHFLEYCEEIVPFFVYRKRIKQYVEYVDDELWEEETGRKSPTIRLVAKTPVLQRRLQRFIKKYLNNFYMSAHARFLVTNIELLKTSTEPAIWTQIIQE